MEDPRSLNLTSLIRRELVEMVKQRVSQKNVDVNFKDDGSNAPIHVAAEIGNKDILKLLIQAGADLNIQEDEYHKTPIFLAKDLETAQILIKAGAEVNVRKGPLHLLQMAVIENKKWLVEYLIAKCGVNVDISDCRGATPLHSACCSVAIDGFDLDITKFLIRNNADVNKVNGHGRTPIIYFLMYLKPSLDDKLMNLFKFIIKYSDITVNDFRRNLDCAKFFDPRLCNVLSEQVSILISLGMRALIDPINGLISIRKEFKDYFEACKDELSIAKSMKLRNSWVTFYNLLTDNKRRLKNYAGNKDLMEDFKNTNFTINFPIYGKQMIAKMDKAIQIRKIYDESCNLLSNHVPIFGPYHLIVRDVLDCLGCSTKDLARFCAKIN